MDVKTFVARQPVFNQQERVYGYELLFRSSPENVFRSNNPDKASATVVDKLLTFGSKSLTDGR